MGSSPSVSPPPKEAASGGLRVATFVHRRVESELGEDFFMCPHLINSSEALFMVDDAPNKPRGRWPLGALKVSGWPCPRWAMRLP